MILEAMRHYAGNPPDLEETFALTPTAREAVEGMLQTGARLFTGDGTPRGCLLASVVVAGSRNAAAVRDAAAQERGAIGSVIVERIEGDVARGLLPGATPPWTLSELAPAVTQGISVLARDGADRETS